MFYQENPNPLLFPRDADARLQSLLTQWASEDKTHWLPKGPLFSKSAIEAQRGRIQAAQDRIPLLQSLWAHALKHRIEAQNNPLMKLRYQHHKYKMMELEAAIDHAKEDVTLEQQSLALMSAPMPHAQRGERGKRIATKTGVDGKKYMKTGTKEVDGVRRDIWEQVYHD